jgi:hypothetical protein
MKNLIVALCLLFNGFFNGTLLFCRDFSPGFPAGVFPARGGVSELKVLQDGRGNVYVLYIEDGRFLALKADGRGGLEPYRVEGLDEALYGARRLELSGFGIDQYAAFAGLLNGSEGVFVLGLDGDTLRHYPVPELQGLGVVSKHFITASSPEGAAVFVLSGGKLSCAAGIGRKSGVPVYTAITGAGERIGNADDFDLMADFHCPLGRGWFTVRRGDKREAVIFSLDSNFLVHRESAGSYVGDIRLINSMDIKGDSIITVINNNHVELYKSAGTGFLRRLSFDAPETASWFAAPFEHFGILSVGTENAETVYGVKNSEVNAPLFDALFNSTGKNRLALFYGGTDFYLAGKKGDDWHVMSLDSHGAITGGQRLDGIGNGEKLFAYGAGENPHLYFFDPARRLITIYEKQDTLWRIPDRVDLPGEISAGDVDWDGAMEKRPLFFGDRLITVNAKGGTLFFEPKPGRIGLLENSAIHASRNINGVSYCVVYNNGEITLFRIEEAD